MTIVPAENLTREGLCRQITMEALRKARRLLRKEMREKDPFQEIAIRSMIATLTETITYLDTNPFVFYVYLEKFISKDDMKRLSERNIKTIYKLATSDIREVRKILRRKNRSFPTILLYLHPEKKGCCAQKKSHTTA